MQPNILNSFANCLLFGGGRFNLELSFVAMLMVMMIGSHNISGVKVQRMFIESIETVFH